MSSDYFLFHANEWFLGVQNAIRNALGRRKYVKVILGVNLGVNSHNVMSLLEERKKKSRWAIDFGLDIEYL